MPDLADGQTAEYQGSGAKPYILKNSGGVYSCTCPAWRNQSLPIEQRTCKHLRAYRGEDAEEARLGNSLPSPRKVKSAEGEPTTIAPPLLLAESWDNASDLSGWWLSEKLDGVRAYWDGTQFLSRQGNIFVAPEWFRDGLPTTPLDGELWIERKKFQRTVSIVRRHDQPETWKEVRFIVFDAPALDAPFEERQAHLLERFQRIPLPYVQVLAQDRCPDIEGLRRELLRVEALGGEGLMLRQPGSRYQAGRSTTLLKVKTFLDAEALVRGHQPGAGRHKGRLGALLVELADGTRFAVGTGFSDAERGNPPPIGTTISFRYQELTDAGVPRFPSYVRMRLPE